MTESGYEPGFYQGIRGRKTGRPAPNPGGVGGNRAPRHEQVLARHGLIDQGAADPNQGQLFNPTAVLGPARSDAALARDRNTSPPIVAVRPTTGKSKDLPLAGAPGFMPGLDKKQKVKAIHNVQAARGRTGRGYDAPFAGMMADRAEIRGKADNAPWYMGVDETGQHRHGIPGDSARFIETAARQVGTTPEVMARATANTSPQNVWDKGGSPANPDYSLPNIEDAKRVISGVDALRDPTPEEVEEVGSAAIGGDGGLRDMGAKAALQYHAQGTDVTKPIEMKGRVSQKVPNFEASLNLSHIDPAVVRGASQAYTVDTHDAAIVGVDEQATKQVGVYEAVAMTGRRTALKNWQLPPNEQAREWVAQRGSPSSVGDQSMFVAKRSGKLEPNPAALPTQGASHAPPSSSRSMRRGAMRSIAEIENDPDGPGF